MNSQTMVSATAANELPRARRSTFNSSGLWFKLPAVVGLLLIIGYPLVRSLQMSLTSYSPILPGREGQWVGGENYVNLLHDGAFRGALWRTAIFTFFAVAIELFLGLGLAILLQAATFGQRLLRSLMMIPMILTPVVIGLIFGLLLNPQFGALNWFFREVGLTFALDALNDPKKALPALILVDVWQWTPFMALLIFAGLQAMPTEPLEAAQVDGASRIQALWYVIVPMLRPVMVVAVLFRASEAVREFDKVFVLTGGGPGDATLLSDLFTYRISFVVFDLSYGAAIGMVVFVITLLAGTLFYAVVRRGGRIA